MEKDRLIAKQQEEIRVLKVILNRINDEANKVHSFNTYSKMQNIKYYLELAGEYLINKRVDKFP